MHLKKGSDFSSLRVHRISHQNVSKSVGGRPFLPATSTSAMVVLSRSSLRRESTHDKRDSLVIWLMLYKVGNCLHNIRARESYACLLVRAIQPTLMVVGSLPKRSSPSPNRENSVVVVFRTSWDGKKRGTSNDIIIQSCWSNYWVLTVSYRGDQSWMHLFVRCSIIQPMQRCFDTYHSVSFKCDKHGALFHALMLKPASCHWQAQHFWPSNEFVDRLERLFRGFPDITGRSASLKNPSRLTPLSSEQLPQKGVVSVLWINHDL